jgi:hypothetical protein
MPIWLVKATWTEDEAEASEQWEVKADTAQDAVREVTTHLRFAPRHIEAKLSSAESAGQTPEIEHPRDRVHRISTR